MQGAGGREGQGVGAGVGGLEAGQQGAGRRWMGQQGATQMGDVARALCPAPSASQALVLDALAVWLGFDLAWFRSCTQSHESADGKER